MKLPYFRPRVKALEFDVDYLSMKMLFFAYFHGCDTAIYAYVKIAMALFSECLVNQLY